MHITILYRGKKMRFVRDVSIRRAISTVVLGCVLFLISSRSVDISNEYSSRIHYAKSGLEQQQGEIENFKASTQDQLSGMMLKLGQIESQLHKIDSLGQRLVTQAQLDETEFSFFENISDQDVYGLDTAPLGQETDIVLRIDELLALLQGKSRELEALETIMLGHHIENETALTGRPIEKGWLSSYYGMRKDPFTGLPAMHKGLDFAGNEGDPVIATGAGVVVWAGERFGYGKLVEIDHGNGVATRYGHNKSLIVKVGDVVTKGQAIATMGSTGRSTGVHVHYEVLKQGQQQDPLPFVYHK